MNRIQPQWEEQFGSSGSATPQRGSGHGGSVLSHVHSVMWRFFGSIISAVLQKIAMCHMYLPHHLVVQSELSLAGLLTLR